MKDRIVTAKPGRSFQGSNGQVQVYEVVTASGTIYDCLSEKCMKLIGQEVEFEVKDPSDPRYHPTMKLPKDGGPGGGGKPWGGKAYIPTFKDTLEGQKLTAKTMAMSYAKDLAAKFVDNAVPGSLAFVDMVNNTKLAYSALVAELGLDKLVDAKPTTSSASDIPAGAKARDRATLLSEMNTISSIDDLAKWWTGLSAEEKKVIESDKDKKKAALINSGGPKF